MNKSLSDADALLLSNNAGADRFSDDYQTRNNALNNILN
jgi:hypothetical protein